MRLTSAAKGNGIVTGELPPTERHGTLTPVAAKVLFIRSSIMDKFAAGLGQSDPFMKAGFQRPRVTSAEK